MEESSGGRNSVCTYSVSTAAGRAALYGCRKGGAPLPPPSPLSERLSTERGRAPAGIRRAVRSAGGTVWMGTTVLLHVGNNKKEKGDGVMQSFWSCCGSTYTLACPRWRRQPPCNPGSSTEANGAPPHTAATLLGDPHWRKRRPSDKRAAVPMEPDVHNVGGTWVPRAGSQTSVAH